LQTELLKFGAKLSEPKIGELAWDGTIDPNWENHPILVETYHDHRMALAFAPAALAYPQISISDPNVITKSYPAYWNDLKKMGFKIE
jgi:3-phosphoshikimate 1-carboxyvinyltransferase